MWVKQIRFYDGMNETEAGGFLLEDGSIICGECGGVFPADELEELGIQILEVYEHWVSLSEEIMGN